MTEPLWRPSREQIAGANLTRFIRFVNERHQTSFSDYDGLYDWSVTAVSDLWAALWDFLDVIHHETYTEVVDDPSRKPGAKWFSGATLNFAENLLRYRDGHPAIIFRNERGMTRRLTYADVYDHARRMAASLKEAGVTAGDRVAGFMPNLPETVIAMLAATSLGAIWSSCSPDFGIKGVLDRFGQINPKVLFTADGYFYNGKIHDSLGKVREILGQLPDAKRLVVVPYASNQPDLTGLRDAVLWDDFIAPTAETEMEFLPVPYQHPLYIMYSSGTTGKPKCMVQCHGGILMNQAKELVLHTDVKREDVIFYFTTCGWMMWNWLVSSLGVGATMVLFDGSPFHPDPECLWRMAEEEKITVFGTSARYIASLEQAGARPGTNQDLSALRAILSTGSPRPPEGFHYVYREIKQDLQLASISGGTDINGCFACGNPIGPVYTGELQARALGLKVFAYNDNGQPVYGETGELVCTSSFPAMPIHFWDDPDGEKYLNAYFKRFPGVWTHGDFIKITEHNGVIIYGRSDATLNPGGVRMGTAEIYSAVESVPEVLDSLVVGQDWEGDVRVVLFVKMAPEQEFNDEVGGRIRKAIRDTASPRHVPAKIVPVADIPYTINMKKVELAVRNVIHGKPVTNRDALANPESLDLFRDLKELSY